MAGQEEETVLSVATIDHLVYATPNLDTTVRHLRDDWGIELVPGGPHPGRGTCNWLAGLGDATYLEVIGPDNDQPRPSSPRPFGVDDLTEARLTAWCVRPNRALADVVADALAMGVDLGTVLGMSRRRPDGVLLEWELTAANPATLDPIVPFCIDWLESEHPTTSLSHNSLLGAFDLSHPDADRIQRALDAIGIGRPVSVGERRFSATLSTPNGELILT